MIVLPDQCTAGAAALQAAGSYGVGPVILAPLLTHRPGRQPPAASDAAIESEPA